MRVADQTFSFIRQQYPPELRGEVTEDSRVRVLVSLKSKEQYTPQFETHLAEHELYVIGKIFDHQTPLWILICETPIKPDGVHPGLRALNVCDVCTEKVLRVTPDSVMSIPPTDMTRSGIPVNKEDSGIPQGDVSVQATIVDMMKAIGVDKVWAALGDGKFGGEKGGCPGVNLAHFDTGAPAVQDSRFWNKWFPPASPTPSPIPTRVVVAKSFAGGEGPQDMHGHGTKTLAIAAGQGYGDDNAYKGCAYRANLYCFKVLGTNGSGLYSWMLAAIIDSRKYPIDVCTMSVGGKEVDPQMEAAIVSNMQNQGQIWCIAAGNDGRFDTQHPHEWACDRSLDSPGSALETFCCGATSGGNLGGQPEAVQSWSSRPPSRDGRSAPKPPRGSLVPISGYTFQFGVMAPGLGIATSAGDVAQSGTSFATPPVAGVNCQLVYAICIAGSEPGIRRTYEIIKRVREAILHNCYELGYWSGGSIGYTKDEAYCIEAWGRIDAWAAHQSLGQGPTPRKFGPATSIPFEFTVKEGPTDKETANLSAISDKGQYIVGDTVTVTAELLAAKDSAPIPSRTVRIAIEDSAGNPTVKTAVTDQNGIATSQFSFDQAQHYSGHAEFDGDP
jgi:hypothetical protein